MLRFTSDLPFAPMDRAATEKEADAWIDGFDGSPVLVRCKMERLSTGVLVPTFDPGKFAATPAALAAVVASGQNPVDFLTRHINGDWGEIDAEDAKANVNALVTGDRLMSVYKTAKGVDIWVITEAAGDDGRREVTTLILPEDY